MSNATRSLLNIGTLLLLAGTAHAQASSSAPCQPQRLLDVRPIKEQIIVVGEPHGTKEIPEFVAGLLCSLLQEGRSVILALERDGNEQSAFNRYMESDGGELARRDLTAFYEWRSKCPDGRSSTAMLALVEEVRRLRENGQRVALVALRQQYSLSIPTAAEEDEPLSSQDNALHNVISDRAMADNLLNAAILYRRYTVVALAGSGHTSTIERDLRGQRFQPMGKLAEAMQPVFFVGFTSSGGKHWGYGTNGCGERELGPGALYQLGTKVDAVVSLPRLTVSRPALGQNGEIR